MALRDFMDRRVTVRAGGRTFIMRPITLSGILEAEAILAEAAPSGEEAGRWRVDLRMAGASPDPLKKLEVLTELYLSLLDKLGADRLAPLLSLVCEPSDETIIRAALDADPVGATAAFFRAAGELHDFSRILEQFVPSPESDVLPMHMANVTGIGLETVVLDLIASFPAYRFEDVLAWPYERFLSFQEQLGILRTLRSGKASEESIRERAAPPSRLRSMGLNVQVRPPKKAQVN